MSRLTIYDSQGQEVGNPSAPKNQRVADFFFDGVRLAIENVERTTVYCFFRARESEGARADQFYAEYETSSVRDVGSLTAEVERAVQDEHGMVMDTSTEDATVFDLIGEASSLRAPGDQETYDAVPKLMNRGERLRFGTSGYRDALGALYKVITGGGRVNRAAIADNADSSQLSDYDVVIETGDYVGLEGIGDTENKIDKEKKRGRGLGQRGGGGGGGLDSTGGSDGGYSGEYGLGGGDTSDDDLSILDQVKVYGVIVGFVVSVLLVIVLLTCSVGDVSVGQLQGVPVLGTQCAGADGGAGGSASFNFTVENESQLVLSWENLNTRNVNLTVEMAGPSIANSTVNVTVNRTGNETIFSTQQNCGCEPIWPPQQDGEYRISAHVNNSTRAETRVRISQNDMTEVTESPGSGGESDTTTSAPQSPATPTTTTSTSPTTTPQQSTGGSTTEEPSTDQSSPTTTEPSNSAESRRFTVSITETGNNVQVQWRGVDISSGANSLRVNLTYQQLDGQLGIAPHQEQIESSSGEFTDDIPSNPVDDYRVIVRLEDIEATSRSDWPVVRNKTISFT